MIRRLFPIAMIIILLALLVLTFGAAPVRSETYSLLDRFITNLAAGSVNGTLAEPTGGARSVTDTNNKISVTNNKLNFATGEAANDGIWYGSVTRSAGVVLLADITLSETTNGGATFGFDSNTSGAINDAIQFGASGALNIIPNGGTAIAVGAYVAATYTVAAVMRASGIYWFIKGDTFTTWTMLWSTTTGSGNGYPAFSTSSATGVFTVDNIRIPGTTFLPVPLVSDGFSASTSDGQGHAEANGGNDLSWTGATWTVAGGNVTNTPALENEMWDAPAAAFTSGTYAWIQYGANTIANDANSLKITYVNDGGGALETFRDASDLSSDLSIGTWYRFSVDAKTGAGNNITLDLGDGSGNNVDMATITETNFVNRIGTFRKISASLAYIRGKNMGAGEILWLDNLSLKPITLSSLPRSTNVNISNVIAEIVLPVYALGSQAGLIIGLDNAETPAKFLVANLNGSGNAAVIQNLNGTYSTIISAATATWNSTYVLRVIKDNTAIRLYYNNTLIGIGNCNAGITGTLVGTFSTISSAAFNNLVAWPRSGYNIPDTIAINTATPTPSNTSTPSSTPTSTNTPTATFTPSNTATATFTPSSTSTATFTPSNTSTATFTPSNTSTATFTPSNTATATFTPSSTSTITDTPTITDTATSTYTPTVTPLFVIEQTFTFGDIFSISTMVIIGLVLLAIAIVIITLIILRNRRAAP